jgi:hypothetical protein
MSAKLPPLVWIVVAFFTVMAAGILALGDCRHEGRTASGEYQRLVGGLGVGPALDLSRCPNSFDPRVCPRCTEDLGPLAGSGHFCPQHACSIFYYPALDGDPLRSQE